MTREELITWALANGWKLDCFGHLQKVAHEGLRRYRLKVGKPTVRYEVHSHAGWGSGAQRLLQGPLDYRQRQTRRHEFLRKGDGKTNGHFHH